jgi:hypothetical protein
MSESDKKAKKKAKKAAQKTHEETKKRAFLSLTVIVSPVDHFALNR